MDDDTHILQPIFHLLNNHYYYPFNHNILIRTNNTRITADDKVVGITEPYISFALEDIEGYGIDGGVKFGGSSLVYFLDEETMNKYKDSDAIGRRRIIYSKTVGGERRIFIQGEHPWQEASEVDDLRQYAHLGHVTVLMVSDITFRGEEIVSAAKVIKTLGADAVYAYVSHLDTVVLDGGEGSLIDCLEKGDLIGEVFTADIVYENGCDGRITVIRPADLKVE